MKLKLSRTAAKQIEKLSKVDRLKVFRKLNQLRQDSSAGKKLQGQFVGSWSLRAWPYRIIYIFSPDKKSVMVKTVQHRQSVYN